MTGRRRQRPQRQDGAAVDDEQEVLLYSICITELCTPAVLTQLTHFLDADSTKSQTKTAARRGEKESGVSIGFVAPSKLEFCMKIVNSTLKSLYRVIQDGKTEQKKSKTAVKGVSKDLKHNANMAKCCAVALNFLSEHAMKASASDILQARIDYITVLVKFGMFAEALAQIETFALNEVEVQIQKEKMEFNLPDTGKLLPKLLIQSEDSRLAQCIFDLQMAGLRVVASQSPLGAQYVVQFIKNGPLLYLSENPTSENQSCICRCLAKLADDMIVDDAFQIRTLILALQFKFNAIVEEEALSAMGKTVSLFLRNVNSDRTFEMIQPAFDNFKDLTKLPGDKLAGNLYFPVTCAAFEKGFNEVAVYWNDIFMSATQESHLLHKVASIMTFCINLTADPAENLELESVGCIELHVEQTDATSVACLFKSVDCLNKSLLRSVPSPSIYTLYLPTVLVLLGNIFYLHLDEVGDATSINKHRQIARTITNNIVNYASKADSIDVDRSQSLFSAMHICADVSRRIEDKQALLHVCNGFYNSGNNLRAAEYYNEAIKGLKASVSISSSFEKGFDNYFSKRLETLAYTYYNLPSYQVVTHLTENDLKASGCFFDLC